MSTTRHAATIVGTWLHMDFFGDPKRDAGSALTSTIFSQSFIALVLAALLFDSRNGLVAYTTANLSLSTLFVGIGALADPQRALRRRAADAALLHTAPLPRSVVPLARAIHGAFYVVLITTGMAIPPAILSYWVAGESLTTVLLYIVNACLLASACAGSLALVLRIAERIKGRGAALLLAGSLRALLLGGGFIAFALCMRLLDESADALPLGRASAWCWPPYWSGRWIANPLDWVPLAALGGLTVFLLLLNTALPETTASRSQRLGTGRFAPISRLECSLAKQQALRGATRFVATMLYRSASFRARVLPLLGVPIAMTILAFLAEDGGGNRLLLGMTMQFPAIYMPFLIAFLPNADHAGTGWVFAASPNATLGLAREACLIAITTRILAPVLVLAAALALFAGESPAAIGALLAYSLGAGVFMTWLQLRELAAMPFTLDDEQQQDGDLGHLLAGGLVLGALGGVFAIYADSMFAQAFAIGLAIVAWRRLGNPPQSTDNVRSTNRQTP